MRLGVSKRPALLSRRCTRAMIGVAGCLRVLRWKKNVVFGVFYGLGVERVWKSFH